MSALGVTLGSINKNVDLNISGRGMLFNFNDAQQTNFFEAGYIQNGYNLLGDGVKNSGLSSAWGIYSGNFKTSQVKTSILHHQLPYTQSDITLIGQKWVFGKKKSGQIDLVCSLG